MDKIELPDGTIIGEGGKSKKRFNFAMTFGIIAFFFSLGGSLAVGLIVYYFSAEIGLIYAPCIKSAEWRECKLPPDVKIFHSIFYGMAFFCVSYFIPALKRAGKIKILDYYGNPSHLTARAAIFTSLFFGVVLGVFVMSVFPYEIISAYNIPDPYFYTFPNLSEYLDYIETHDKLYSSFEMFYRFGWPFFTIMTVSFFTIGKVRWPKILFFTVAVILSYYGIAIMYSKADLFFRIPIIFPMLMVFTIIILIAMGRTKKDYKGAKSKSERMQNQATALHGDARYASLENLAQYGMVDAEDYNFNGNFLLGYYYENKEDNTYNKFPVYSEGDEHIITFAKAGAGKGISSIIPNLLGYEGSVLTIDPKGENAAITARHRRDNLGQKVYLLNPFKMHKEHFKNLGFEDVTHGFNPILAVRSESNAVSIAKQIAQILVPNNPNSKDPFWENRATNMIYALILYLAFHREEKDCNFEELHDLLCLPYDELISLFEDLHKDGHNKSVRKAAGGVLSVKSEKTQSSVIASAQNALSFMDFEQMCHVTSRHDFELADLKNDNITIYLILPVEHLETCSGWLRLMVNRTLSIMSEISHVPDKPVLFLLDEAARLGRLEKLATAPAALRGYGVRVWPIFQGMGQIEHLYKGSEWRDFISNSTVQLFGVNDKDTAKYFSEHMGKHGMVIETYNEGASHNDSGMKGASAGTSQGSSLGVHGRELMTIDEILRMENHEQLILMASKRPARIGKAKYFEMSEFTGCYDKNPYYKG